VQLGQPEICATAQPELEAHHPAAGAPEHLAACHFVKGPADALGAPAGAGMPGAGVPA
jgi:hypothetical protein